MLLVYNLFDYAYISRCIGDSKCVYDCEWSRDIHQNSSVYNSSKEATYNPHLLKHFVIAINVKMFCCC